MTAFYSNPQRVHSLIRMGGWGPDELQRWFEDGNSIAVTDADGGGLLQAFSRRGNLESVRYLVQLGADVDQRNDHGGVPLHFALSLGRVEIAHFLLDQGCDRTVFSSHYGSLLHCARLDQLDLIKRLVAGGADPTLTMGILARSAIDRFAQPKDGVRDARAEAILEVLCEAAGCEVPEFVAKSAEQKAIEHHIEVLAYHDTGDANFAERARRFAELWAELVPDVGDAGQPEGRVLRAVGRLAGEDRRNGNRNWKLGCEEFVDVLRTWLCSGNERITRDVDQVQENGRLQSAAPVDACRVTFGRLIVDAVDFCERGGGSR